MKPVKELHLLQEAISNLKNENSKLSYANSNLIKYLAINTNLTGEEIQNVCDFGRTTFIPKEQA